MFPQPNEEELRKRFPWGPPRVGGQPVDAEAPMPPPPVTMPTGDRSRGPAMDAPAPLPPTVAAPPPAASMHPMVDAPAPAPGAMPPPVAPAREALTGQNVGGVQMSAPMPPPVKAGTPEQDKLKAMTQMGPKTSVLGTLAGLGVRAAAGWASSPGRPAHVNEERQRDWAERNPMGGGSWREGIAQQGQLAGMEQGEVARQQAAAKSAADLAHVKAQTQQAVDVGDWHRQEARNAEQRTEVDRAKEADRYKNTQMARIEQVGGTRREVKQYAKGSPPPAGFGYTMADPYDDTKMLAVRAQPGEEIDADLAKRMNIPQNADGKYYLTAGGAVRAYTSDNTAGAAAERGEAGERREKERVREFDARLGETKANTDLRRQQIADAAETKAQGNRDRAQASIEKLQKEEDGFHAQREAYGQRIATIKSGATVIDPKTGTQVVITSANADAIRQAYQEKYDQATAEAERTNQAKRKLVERHGGETGPAMNLKKSPAAPTSTATGGGGRGGAATPTPAKVWPRARLQGYADTAFGGDAAKTEQYLKSQGYVIQ